MKAFYWQVKNKKRFYHKKQQKLSADTPADCATFQAANTTRVIDSKDKKRFFTIQYNKGLLLT